MYSINSQRLLLFLVVFDIALMPVFHIFGLPFKFFFIPLLYNLLKTWKNAYTFRVMILFIIMIVVIFIGAIYQYSFFNVNSLNYTIFLCTSIFLGYVGYSFGYNIRPIFLDNLLYIAITYSILNISMGFSSEIQSSLDNFYNISHKNWHLLRGHGIFSNPNVSALMVNLLLMMTFLAKRFEMLRSKSNYKILLQFSFSFGALIILSSILHLILFFIISLFFVHIFLKETSLQTSVGIIVFVMTSIFSLVLLSHFASEPIIKNNFEIELIYNGFNKIMNLPQEFVNALSQSEFANLKHSRIYKANQAIEAFMHSPIFGSGFERPIDGPLHNLKIGYHNDWSYILVAGGVIAFSILFIIVYKIWHVHPILALFFVIPGMTHTLMFTMQIFCLYGIIWGIIHYCKQNQQRMIVSN